MLDFSGKELESPVSVMKRQLLGLIGELREWVKS